MNTQSHLSGERLELDHRQCLPGLCRLPDARLGAVLLMVHMLPLPGNAAHLALIHSPALAPPSGSPHHHHCHSDDLEQDVQVSGGGQR